MTEGETSILSNPADPRTIKYFCLTLLVPVSVRLSADIVRGHLEPASKKNNFRENSKLV
jgi:hypothetical protein